MISLKQTYIYQDVLKEITYPFGKVFIFKGYVVSEINKGVHFSWEEHAIAIINDVIDFTGGDGSDIVYISHRIHSYSVVAMDWLKFFRNSFNLNGYGIVTYTKVTALNVIIENMFFNSKIKRFDNLENAIEWAKSKRIASTNSTINKN